MDPVSRERQLEVETWFEFVSTIGDDELRERAVAARSFHVLGEYGREDYARLAGVLESAGGSASFAFLGRDVEEQAPIIENLDARGHEIVYHGHRHIGWGAFDFDEAHRYFQRGYEALVGATGVEPRGFFAPLKDVTEGTLRAAAEFGIDWVLGRCEGAVPPEITLVDTYYPHDNRLLEPGSPPAEAFDRLSDAADGGETFLFHPNMLAYHDATAAFDDWLEVVSPVAVREQLEAGGVGIVMDCVRPLKVA